MKPFDTIDNNHIILEDELFLVKKDKYPVSPGHTLIIVKRSAERFQDLTSEEKLRLMKWIDWCINYLQEILKPKPDGFNIGLNDGAAAGQTVGQVHVHVIPRYFGDVTDPRGGVRFVIPQRGKYWKD